jgi:DNA-binding SARP family transcriptional activator
MGREFEASGLNHYAGISFHNAGYAAKIQGDAAAARSCASRALELLLINSSLEEITAARLVRIWAHAHIGLWPEAQAEIAEVLTDVDDASRPEAQIEIADVHLWYGDRSQAGRLLAGLETPLRVRQDLDASVLAVRLEHAIRENDLSLAREIDRTLPHGELAVEPGFVAHAGALEGYLAVRARDPDAKVKIEAAKRHAQKQRAWFWFRYCEMLDLLAAPREELSAGIRATAQSDPAYISMFPDDIVARLTDVDDAAMADVAGEIARRPWRWRPSLRAVVDSDDPCRWAAATLLEEIGEREDIARLRKASQRAPRTSTQRSIGTTLARRLADRVVVNDLGRVSIRVGDRTTTAEVRRKVLALLCFLVTRPTFSATRDEVVEALWPDLEPTVALNSLNQTVYFLRRVFEPSYADAVSPRYLMHDSNVVWLDPELVDSQSAKSWRLIRSARDANDVGAIDDLSLTYSGRFALDFAYEDWAIAYRDGLHAAYLQVMESAIARDTVAGAYPRAIDLARRALEADPDADAIELSLLRLYRLSGAHAAAAEQYAHYASVQRREFGVEPPQLETL